MTVDRTHYRDWEPLLPASASVAGPILVVAPHPDDEIIGCGGILAAHRDAGESVHVAVVTDGGQGQPGGPGGVDYVAMREEETRRALDVLGGGEVHFLRHSDGGLRGDWSAVPEITALVERVRPSKIFVTSPFEVHPDHRATALIAFRALRALAEPPEIWCYEIGAMMPVNVLFDVTAAWPRKERAIGCFASQLLHQDLIQKVRAVARARTVNCDDPAVTAAEGYLRVEAARAAEFLRAVDSVLVTIDGMRP